jgi:hypothetical protein
VRKTVFQNRHRNTSVWRNRHPKSLYFGYAHASPHNRIYSATSARYGYVALAYLRCPTRSCPPGPNICSSRTRLWTAPRAARALRQRQTSHGTCTCHKDRMRQRQGHCLCEAPARTTSHGGKARTLGRSLRCSVVALSHNLYSVRARRSMLTSPLRHAVPASHL